MRVLRPFIGIWIAYHHTRTRKFLYDDSNLEIPGYSIIRDNYPSNTKRGGVCVYYKNTLPFELINIKYLQKSIWFEIRIG